MNTDTTEAQVISQAIEQPVNNMPLVASEPKAVATAETQSSQLMGALIAAASNPTTDIVRMEKMYELFYRIKAEESRKAYFRDFAAMKGEIPKVVKNKTNRHLNSKYADLDAINEAIDPVLARYGFGTSTRILAQDDSSITGEVSLTHREGHRESTGAIIMPLAGEGLRGNSNMTPSQALVASTTYLERAGKCILLNIRAGEDNDGNAPPKADEFITSEQAIAIDQLITDASADRAAFFKFLKMDETDSRKILKINHTTAVNMLNRKMAESKKEAK